MQDDAEKIAEIIDREVRDALTMLAHEPSPDDLTDEDMTAEGGDEG
jgi:hypothetical protein